MQEEEEYNLIIGSEREKRPFNSTLSVQQSAERTKTPVLDRKTDKRIKKTRNALKNFDQKANISALLGQQAIDNPEVYKSDSG